MKRLAIVSGSAILALSLLGVGSAANVPVAGGLDPSFAGDGAVIGTGAEYAGIAVQPDGKIVVAGTTTDEHFLLARYLPDGSLDPSFGVGGQVQTQVGDWGFAGAVALQPDGKIVVAGGSYQGGDSSDPEILEEFTLARYDANGSLDTSFGTNGIVNTVIPEPGGDCFPNTSSSANGLAILPSGDILSGGWANWTDGCSIKSGYDVFLVLARYKADGLLDPSFGDGGIVQTAGGGGGPGMAVQPDGEIVATQGGAPDRFAPDGSLNLSFDNDPKIRYVGAMAVQDGRIVVAGVPPAEHISKWHLVVARYKRNGRLDPTFGKDGRAELERVSGLARAIVVQKDGKLLISSGPPGGGGPFTVVRLLRDGRLDTHFGRGGIVRFGDVIESLALQTDGKVLAAGGNGNESMLARLLGGNNCVVPGLRGTTVSRASTALGKSYCRRGHVTKRFSGRVAPGRTISTAPARGARLPGGARVDLVVSKGERP